MNKLRLIFTAAAVAGTLSLSAMAPASADGAASTRNIIFGAAALAGLAIESNVAHKNAQAATISGYLPDGSAVYGDGHVVAGNGYSYYPGNDGQNVSCNDGRCSIGYANQNDNGYNGYAQRGSPDNRYDDNRNDGRHDGGRPSWAGDRDGGDR